VRALAAITILAGTLASPVLACVPTSPNAVAWAKCAHEVAKGTGEQDFMKSMASAIVNKKKLKPTSMPRWEKLEGRIEGKCGDYAAVLKRDTKLYGKSHDVPDDQFEAIAVTFSLFEPWKPNA